MEVGSMKEKYKNYLNKDHSFDRITMVGIFCLIIVIAGIIIAYIIFKV